MFLLMFGRKAPPQQSGRFRELGVDQPCAAGQNLAISFMTAMLS
jgi:hypothetical protein